MKKVVITLLIGAAFMVGHHFMHATTPAQLDARVVGKGKPMIMIPGLTCDGAVWDSTIKAMGDNYQYHVLTLPGFAGQAPLENLEDGFFDQIRALIYQYIDENKIEKPIIMGHSLGGFLALQIAIEKPELPEKLVIVDALPFLTSVQMPGMSAENAKDMAIGMRAQMRASASQTYEQKFAYQKAMLPSMIIDEQNIETAADWGAKSDMNTVGQAMYEMYTTDIRSELDKIEVPILVLGAWVAYKDFGSTRESVLSTYTSQYEKAKDVVVDLTDKGNHFIMWDDSEFFQNWLNKFLSN